MLALHEDPDRWDRLIESVGPASILVLIGRSMSRQLHVQMSPEDIWQDTLCAAWRDRGQHRWGGLRAFRAWLLEIAQNRVRDAARRAAATKRGGKKRVFQFSGLADSSGNSISALLPPGSTTPSRICAHKETAAAMDAALRELSPELEPLVRMYLFEEMPMETIAERLGIGVSAAWYRFRKGSEIYGQRLDRLKEGSGQRRGRGAGEGIRGK